VERRWRRLEDAYLLAATVRSVDEQTWLVNYESVAQDNQDWNFRETEIRKIEQEEKK